MRDSPVRRDRAAPVDIGVALDMDRAIAPAEVAGPAGSARHAGWTAVHRIGFPGQRDQPGPPGPVDEFVPPPQPACAPGAVHTLDCSVPRR